MKGARDADFADKRAALIMRLRDRLALAGADHPSFRHLAECAGVSQTTLRHYFGGLPDLVASVLEAHAAEGAPYLEHLARPCGPFARSVADALRFVAAGQRQAPVRAIHAIGAAEGVRRRAAGAAYRTAALDPVLGAAKRRLDAHVEAGEMRPCDTRAAAIALCAPVLLAFQHQADLGGQERDPIDIDALVEAHADGFVRGYRA